MRFPIDIRATPRELEDAVARAVDSLIRDGATRVFWHVPREFYSTVSDEPPEEPSADDWVFEATVAMLGVAGREPSARDLLVARGRAVARLFAQLDAKGAEPSR